MRGETIGDRLATARRARFVGRERELALFDALLDVPRSPAGVLFVHGPGGVGKSALLHAFGDRARAAGRPAVLVDGRDVEPTPAGFLRACGDDPGPVLLIDSYELLGPIDGWLRREFAPQLAEDTVVVVAGREPPGKGWRADPGWSDLMQVVGLANLPDEDARGLLAAAGVALARHDEIVDLTQGHPLALSLVVDVLAHHPDGPDLGPLRSHEVVQHLVRNLVEELPSPAHRRALETCSLVRATTRRHLQATRGNDDADIDELFDWLQRLSFMQQCPSGLFPHDLARDALVADLRWRDPAHYRSLMHSLLRLNGQEIRAHSRGGLSHQALVDMLFTPRSHPTLRRYWNFSRLGELRSEPVEPPDRDEVLGLLREDEGHETAELAARWWEVQPDAFRVSRDAAGDIESLVGWLDLTAAAPTEVSSDPVTRRAWDFLQRHNPPSGTDRITIARFLSPARDERRRRATVALSSYELLRRVFGQPELTWDFFVCANPEWCGPLLGYCNYEQIEDGTIRVGDHTCTLFARDWRTWPQFLSRIIDEDDRRRRSPDGADSGAAMSPAELAAAVRQALRNLHRPDELERNPLVRTRLLDGVDPGQVPARLTELLHEAIESLALHPADEKLHRILDRTYLRPAANQELAAELLGLPSSTYRRHLSRAIGRVADALRQRMVTG